MDAIVRHAKGTPSPEAWSAITAALDGLDAEAQAAAVAAVEAHSAHWPTTLDPWQGYSCAPGDELRRSPERWVREIYLGQHAPKHRLVRILESPRRPMRGQSLPHLLDAEAQLPHVRQVGFSQAKLPGAFLKSWRGPEGTWRRWEALRLWTCDLNAAALKVLAGADLASLTMLNLEQNQMGQAGVEALVKAPAFRALRQLHLGFNKLDTGGAQALHPAAWLRSLTWLNLHNNLLSDGAMAQLTRDGALASLAWLSLAHNPVGIDTTPWAADLPALETLIVHNTALHDGGLAGILAGCPRLHTLNLDGTFVGDAGAAALAASGQRWKALALRLTKITAAGLETLLRSPALAEVERLELGSGLTLDNARLLVEGACPRLKYFWWYGPEMEDGAEALLRGNARIAATLPYA